MLNAVMLRTALPCCVGSFGDFEDNIFSEEDLPSESDGEERHIEDVPQLPFCGDADDKELHHRMVRVIEQYSSLVNQDEYTDVGGEDVAGWHQAAYKRLSSQDPESQFVADYAYDHYLNYRNNVMSLKVANAVLRINATRQHPSYGPPDPSGFRNCWPTSIQCCEDILRSPDLNRFLFHCCVNGCEHWWPFMPEYKQHFRECKGCKLCRCPHCGANRFKKDSKGLRGAARCWLFFDAFQNMMLDPELATAVLSGREARNDANVPDDDPSKPSFEKCPEGQRLLNVLPDLGYNLQKVALSYTRT
jgi:hypothetical protein